jgi:hypothetical protein
MQEEEIEQQAIINRGVKLQSFLEDQDFQDIIKLLQNRIQSEWQQAKTQEKREEQWHQMQALQQIMDSLKMQVYQKNQLMKEPQEQPESWGW